MPRTMMRALSSVERGGGIRMAPPETGTGLLLRSACMMSGASFHSGLPAWIFVTNCSKPGDRLFWRCCVCKRIIGKRVEACGKSHFHQLSPG